MKACQNSLDEHFCLSIFHYEISFVHFDVTFQNTSHRKWISFLSKYEPMLSYLCQISIRSKFIVDQFTLVKFPYIIFLLCQNSLVLFYFRSFFIYEQEVSNVMFLRSNFRLGKILWFKIRLVQYSVRTSFIRSFFVVQHWLGQNSLGQFPWNPSQYSLKTLWGPLR